MKDSPIANLVSLQVVPFQVAKYSTIFLSVFFSILKCSITIFSYFLEMPVLPCSFLGQPRLLIKRHSFLGMIFVHPWDGNIIWCSCRIN